MRTASFSYVSKNQFKCTPSNYAGVCLQNTYDYSPFGVNLDGRSVKGDFYRYGYQGSEMDNEIRGDGNSYSTLFRQVDPRLGRWLSIDPKATAWESPFVGMGNNPIYYNDKQGDVFDPASQKTIDNHKESTRAKIKSVEESIKFIEEKIKSRGVKGPSQNQTNKLSNLKSDLTEFNNALSEIGDLENSTQMFTLNKTALITAYGTGENGKTYHSNGVIMLDYVDESSLAHELKHAYQFETGEISFSKNTENAGHLHDANDEIEAYKREGAYDGDFRKRNITASEIRSRSTTSYGNLPNGPLNVNSTIDQVLTGRSIDWDNWLKKLEPGQESLPYGPYATLFNNVIK